MADCKQNSDPLILVREGTSQDQRMSAALDPAYAQVDERTTAHGMVFAQDYAKLLKYFGADNVEMGDWTPFFSKDVSAQLALVAVEDVEAYKANIKSCFDYLNQRENRRNTAQLKNNLGLLFNSVATLAQRLDVLKEELSPETPLKGALQNLIKTRLAPVFKRLIAYYKAGSGTLINQTAIPSPQVLILRSPVVSFASILKAGLSEDWIIETNDDKDKHTWIWADYASHIDADHSVYGDGRATVFVRINHIATHNLFQSIFDQFLKVYARIVNEAAVALDKTLTGYDGHEPHYALFLAFLRLFEYVRREINTLTGRHLDYYYREILRLKEKTAEPGHAHLLIELAKHAASREFKTGELFKAGKDDSGRDAFFANDRTFVANQAKIAALKTVYRHGDKPVGTTNHSINKGRIYASPIANSDDGSGAVLTTADQSWHPFSNKAYLNGKLDKIQMPEAEIGFAIASHYLLMAEGTRTITLDFTISEGLTDTNSLLKFGGEHKHKEDIRCQFTGEKGWVEASITQFKADADKKIQLVINLAGAAPAVTPYSTKIHGYDFATDLPILMVKLLHHDDQKYIYALLQDAVITNIGLKVDVSGFKTLAVSNDFGPVDTAKPFQPFGASPVVGNSLIIGSKEAFQKNPESVSVQVEWPVEWQTAPAAYPASDPLPKFKTAYLINGAWQDAAISATAVGLAEYEIVSAAETLYQVPEFTPNEFYSTASRHGFVKLSLNGGFGQAAYQTALIHYLRKDPVISSPPKTPPDISPYPGSPPIVPTVSALSMSYTAQQKIKLDSISKEIYENRQGRLFHLAPFGQAEQHPSLNLSGKVYLLPQFDFQRDSEMKESEAEFYIGITGLQPPQNLALLFQVADGTADPLAEKPVPHIHWSYLKNNEWIGFGQNEIQDGTGELLNSGIITFAVPREASDKNSALPAEMYWIRAAVNGKSDAVCRLRTVAAQALKTTFVDKGNSSTFSGKPLAAGAISKLDQPDSAVKTITQPFSSFGGRGTELPAAFHTRISERLRHKDRAIALWDYERLILEAFPQIHKVKCLNHTQYEPNETGDGIYRELAPGHVTIVTIPNLQFHNLHDPLKPYTSLGLLKQIEAFLQKRVSCFAKLHVKNPQFEEVRVEFGLRLYNGFDETYYSNQLQQAITRYLSPWAFGGTSPSFGGKIYKSVLINFIEDQPYVDYVTDFKLFHDVDDKPGASDLDEVEGSCAVSILVSAPASKHGISIIKPGEESTPGKTCSCAS